MTKMRPVYHKLVLESQHVSEIPLGDQGKPLPAGLDSETLTLV